MRLGSPWCARSVTQEYDPNRRWAQSRVKLKRFWKRISMHLFCFILKIWLISKFFLLFVNILTLQAVPAKKNISSSTRNKTLQAVPVLEGTLKIHGIIHKIAPVCLRSRKRHSFTVSSLNSIRDYFRLRKQHSVLFSLCFNSFRSFQPKPKRPTCHLLVPPQRGAASSTRKKNDAQIYWNCVIFFYLCAT